MNYFLAPRSGEKSYKNFQSTIKNGVPFKRIEQSLDDEGKKTLSVEDVIYAWGNREGTRSQWELMENGDTVIFYAHRKLVMAGEVYYKVSNEALALAMWPRDENGKPWKYTFFLKNLRYISIPMQAFNLMVGYKPNFIVQGFTHLTDVRIDAIQKQFGSVENLLDQFSNEASEEIPLSNEAVYVNISEDIQPEIISKVSVKPRRIQEISKPKTNKKPFKTDYLERSRTNAVTGSKGEELVLMEEIKRLEDTGHKDLALKVKRVSVDDDTLGYDVLSFDQDGSERYIEVKTSAKKSTNIRFFMSQNEHDASRTLNNYYIYYVDGINDIKPRITQIKDPLKNNYFLVRTDTYIVEGTRK